VTDANHDLTAELVASGIDRREARWLIEEFFLGGDPDTLVDVRNAAARRLAGEPLQYIIGHWPFRTLDLDVDGRVLIPRPETEELVDVALRELALRNLSTPVILDLGCGSGAIGLSLLAELKERGIAATLVAVDESLDALAVAKSNALKHGLYAVSFVHSSWYASLDASLQGRIDLIVSNPPYISEVEMGQLDDVLSYEPRTALVASDTTAPGFDDLEDIISGAASWLTGQGILVAEHGYLQRDAVLESAKRAGFSSYEDLHDMAGHPRILVARQ